ncbi:hypothetical protein BCR36DRAFT_583189 [Piromyces finnis]|uniref:VTC domain-containing protein n=1 Tax=Piromyces finnis TaxID=1754191 RepID=A0A1Y1VCF7_9FUNG|nr:hypothetical protein BCR36DRAFT_583189 [Piromyces finnis]|eukprot:ORX51142.1 hypothetical protein BCR36DRAFT_583189 [Piromyces finnis]
MKPINFPIFLIEYNQSKTTGWANSYVNAENFKFLFLNKNQEVNIEEIKEKCNSYDDVFNLIAREFEVSSHFLKDKLKEIHENIQSNLDKVNHMKSKIEGTEDFLDELNIGLDSNTINGIAQGINESKDSYNNSFQSVGEEEDPLRQNNLENSLPAHLNNNALWSVSSNPSESSPLKTKFTPSNTSIKKAKHRYHASVSNPNVQKEFWKNAFYEAERKNLELCLLEKYAFSHRRLLENIIKAIEILFKYHPYLFSTVDYINDTTKEKTLKDGPSVTIKDENSEINTKRVTKTKFINRVEQNIWKELWLPKSMINICLLKLSKLYDEIRQSEKFYLETREKYIHSTTTSVDDEASATNHFNDFYQHTDFNSSQSSLQGLLNKKKNKKDSGGDDDLPKATQQENSKKPKVDNKSFVRKSIKYWIHPDYVTEVKAIILRHLPIYVFGDNHDLDHPKNPLISSVYYDNHDLELYHHRLHKSHLAIAFRYRWYGELKWNHQMLESEYQANQAINKSEVFAERKTHKEDWTGDNSVKERFSIDPSKINDFNRGKYKIDATDNINNIRPLKRKASKMNNKGEKQSEEEYYKEQEKLLAKVALAQEIQTTIIERQLRPTMRTIYNRTAFQLPDDQRVRVSLDTELTFVREDLKAKKGEWKRDDVGMNWPYRHLKNTEKYLFPYAVLEVKLQTQFGQEPPQWINELTTSYLVEPVPKFSKFMHGCAMLIPEKVKINPYWFYRMYEADFNLRSPLNVATLRETSMCPVKMPWNMSTVITNFDIISPTLRRSITSRKNRITRPTRREPKLSLANERLFLKYFKLGILVCNVSTVIYYFGNPVFGVSYTFAGLIFIAFGYYIYQWREKRIQQNPNRLPLDSMPSLYVIASVLATLFIFNLINIYTGRFGNSYPAKLYHLQNTNVINHRN